MQRLEVSGAVRHPKESLGFKGLKFYFKNNLCLLNFLVRANNFGATELIHLKIRKDRPESELALQLK